VKQNRDQEVSYATPEDREQAQTSALSIAIKELIKKELLALGNPPSNLGN